MTDRAEPGLTDAWTAYCKSRGFGGFVYARPHDEYLAFSAGYAAGQAHPQGQGEPVAWLYQWDGQRDLKFGPDYYAPNVRTVTPLYAASQPADQRPEVASATRKDAVAVEPVNTASTSGHPLVGGRTLRIDPKMEFEDMGQQPLQPDQLAHLESLTFAAPAASPPADAATIATLETRLREVAAERAQAEARIALAESLLRPQLDRVRALEVDATRQIDRRTKAEAARDEAVALLRKMQPELSAPMLEQVIAFLATQASDKGQT